MWVELTRERSRAQFFGSGWCGFTMDFNHQRDYVTHVFLEFVATPMSCFWAVCHQHFLTILQVGHQYVDPYIHGRDSTEGTSLIGPRALKRCARRETRRSASDEIDEWLVGDHPTVLGIVIQYNILPSSPLIHDLKGVSRAYVRLVGTFLITDKKFTKR